MAAARGAFLTIGQLAGKVGVNVETIRFYQRKRLLREPDRPLGGIRRYGPADAARIRFIKSAQRLGFSLDEVGQLLHLDDGMQCGAAARLATRHLADVRARLADLGRIEGALAALLGRCARHRGEVSCPLIASLHVDTEQVDMDQVDMEQTDMRRAARAGEKPRGTPTSA